MQKTLPTLLLALAWLLALAPGAAAQAQPTVSARLSTGVAKLGAPVDLVVTVDGAAAGELGALPAVSGLAFGIVRGPQTSQTMTSRNGRMTIQRQVTWRVPVIAREAGDFQIPGFEVLVDGRRYATPTLGLRVREDLAGAELGFLELETSPRRLVVGQPFDLTLTFGWDASLSAKVNHADLSLPWWDDLFGVVEVEAAERNLGARTVQVQLNGRTRLAVESLGVQEVRGRPFDLFRVRKSYLATHAGTLELPTSHLEFGQMSQGGFFENPRPIELYYVAASPDPIEVGTLPEAGRPLAFTGAVGRIEARATVDRRDVDLGDSLKLRVEWTGDGNLEFFDLPDLGRTPGFEGFRAYGATEELRQRFARVAVFDLAPLDPDLTELPGVPLWVYDPEEGAYGLVETDPIPIRVRALAGAAGLEVEGEVVEATDIRGLDAAGFTGRAGRAGRAGGVGRGDGGPPLAGVLGGLGGVVLAWGVLRRPLRGGVDPASASARRRRRARSRLVRALGRASDPAARHLALCAYLADRTGEEAVAWMGRDPALWWTEREPGPAPDPAVLAELDAVLDGLEHASWGSGGPGPDDRRVLAAVDALAGGVL